MEKTPWDFALESQVQMSIPASISPPSTRGSLITSRATGPTCQRWTRQGWHQPSHAGAKIAILFCIGCFW
jgi:hypothetical protein